MDWGFATLPQLLNTAGLLLDIGGVLLLFKFGLPSKLKRPTRVIQQDEGEFEAKERRYKIGAYCGLTILIIGFALQIAGTWARG